MTSSIRHPDGYIARIAYDDDLGAFCGTVANSSSVITFYGASVAEMRAEFERSIQTYYEVCRERGLEPKKPTPG